MRLNQKLLTVLLTLCMVLSLCVPVSAASPTASYGASGYSYIGIYGAPSFEDNVIPARNAEGKCGLIDPRGNVVMPFLYDDLLDIGCGQYIASDYLETGGTVECIVNAEGETILAPAQQTISASGRIITVLNEQEKTARFYDRDLQPVALEGFDWVYQLGGADFAPDSTRFYSARSTDHSTFLLLNSAMSTVGRSNDYYYWTRTGEDGDIVYYTHGSLYSSAGKLLTDPSLYREIWETEYPFLSVYDYDGHVGALSFTGEELLHPSGYERISMSQEGYLYAQLRSDPAAGDEAGVATEVWKDGTLYHTYSGKKVEASFYDRPLCFSASENGLCGLMTPEGNVIVPENYISFHNFRPGYYFAVKPDQTTQVLNASGALALTESYTWISRIGPGESVFVMGMTGENREIRNVITGELVARLNGSDYPVISWSDGTDSSAEAGLMSFSLPSRTIYVNYLTGELLGELPVQASLYDRKGHFTYKTVDGLYGVGRLSWDGMDPDTPSEWAAAEVRSAIAAGLVPQALQGDYRAPISRAQVSRMFLLLLEQSSGKTADVLMQEQGVAPSADAFRDTRDSAVLAAHALGLFKGKAAGIFDPDGTLTRAEIAAVINRAARLLGVDTTLSAPGFTDVPPDHWVYSELGWPASAGIIQGNGAGGFDPSGQLTIEQAILISARALNALKTR